MSQATETPDHPNRLVTFRERVPLSNVLRSLLLLVVLCFLCVALFPREKVPVAFAVLAGVLAIPYFGLPTLFRFAPQFIRVTYWGPLVGFLTLLIARKKIAADFGLALVAIAVLGLYLGAYFWLFSDWRFWAVVDESVKSDQRAG